ncbi:MAG: pilus assembly protein PilM [Candidatus Metalachnospira sp.]|nr:pilus assembly protein PilM [Candidatus Metalachnospira sp.]
MSKTYTGIHIGTYSIKLTQVTDGKIENLVIEAMPDNLIKDGRILSVDAMASFIKGLVKSTQIKNKNAAVVLSSETSFSRRTTMPYMPIDQLKLNLPYEFHDYIQYDKDKYNYDYAVIGKFENEDGKIEALDLLIAAVNNEILDDYNVMLRKLGFKMVLALPENLTYRNIIRQYQKISSNCPDEYCIVDMGHSAIRMHMYNGSIYDTTRVIEYGGAALDALIADYKDVDIHIASNYKITNMHKVQELDICMELYNKIAVEILRALNFYRYNNPDSNLHDIYFCGGLVRVNALMEIIRLTIDGDLHNISELLPDFNSIGNNNTDIAPAAIGITMQ